MAQLKRGPARVFGAPRALPVKAPPPLKALPPLDVDLLVIMDTDSKGRLHVSPELAMAAHYEHLNGFVTKAMVILQTNDPTIALFDMGRLCDSLRSRHRFLGLPEQRNFGHPGDVNLGTSLTAQPCSDDGTEPEVPAPKRHCVPSARVIPG
jgi:hypothetical protein